MSQEPFSHHRPVAWQPAAGVVLLSAVTGAAVVALLQAPLLGLLIDRTHYPDAFLSFLVHPVAAAVVAGWAGGALHLARAAPAPRAWGAWAVALAAAGDVLAVTFTYPQGWAYRTALFLPLAAALGPLPLWSAHSLRALLSRRPGAIHQAAPFGLILLGLSLLCLALPR